MAQYNTVNCNELVYRNAPLILTVLKDVSHCWPIIAVLFWSSWWQGRRYLSVTPTRRWHTAIEFSFLWHTAHVRRALQVNRDTLVKEMCINSASDIKLDLKVYMCILLVVLRKKKEEPWVNVSVGEIFLLALLLPRSDRGLREGRLARTCVLRLLLPRIISWPHSIAVAGKQWEQIKVQRLLELPRGNESTASVCPAHSRICVHLPATFQFLAIRDSNLTYGSY